MDKNIRKIYVGLIMLSTGLVLNSFKDSIMPDNSFIQKFIPYYVVLSIMVGIIYIIIGVYKANKAYKDSNKK